LGRASQWGGRPLIGAAPTRRRARRNIDRRQWRGQLPV